MPVPTPEEVQAANNFFTYLKGWQAGAANVTPDVKILQSKLAAIYVEGYGDGQSAYGEVRSIARGRFGYKPSILRNG